MVGGGGVGWDSLVSIQRMVYQCTNSPGGIDEVTVIYQHEIIRNCQQVSLHHIAASFRALSPGDNNDLQEVDDSAALAGA